jgi:serine/threonine-protein kinase
LLNLQCTAEPPPLPDEVRGGLPRGVESLLFQLLEKAPEDRPYLAEDVIERLEPFQAAGPAKSGGGRAPVTPRANATTPSSAERRTARPVAELEERAAREVEKDEAAPKAQVERADTIALVERAGKPRDVPPAVAVGVIVALSALAGIAAYVLRAGAAPEGTPSVGPTAAITAPVPFRKDQRR